MKIVNYKNGRFQLEDGTFVNAPPGAHSMDLFIGLDSEEFNDVFNGTKSFEEAAAASAEKLGVNKNVQMGRQQKAADRRDNSILSRRLSRLR